MKKLFFIIILSILCCNIAVAKDEIWKCQKISSKDSKCIKYLNNEPDMEFIGKTKNNKPTGYGIVKNDKGTVIGKGIFKMNKDNIMKLVDGITFLYGVDTYTKDNKFYKAKYWSGNIFEGTYLNPNSKKHFSERKIKGKMTYKGDLWSGFSFTGILESVITPSRVKGKLVYPNGDIWVGTFDISGSNPLKKGKYIYNKNNNKDIDFREGIYTYGKNKSFTFTGTWKFRKGDKSKRTKFIGKMVNDNRANKGELHFNDGSKYIGTFKKAGLLNNGKYYDSTGTVHKVKDGKYNKQSKSSKLFNITNYLNLYSILGLVIIGSFLLHLNANKQLYSGEKEFDLVEAIKSFMDTPLGTGIMLLILAIILFKVFNWSSSTDLGRPRFFGHDGG